MRISRSFIDELINRVDIVDLIDSYVSLRKSGREYKACCPFHVEKTPSFTVSPNKQFYHCFGCGAHGTAIGFLINYAQLSYIEAVQELASRTGIEVVYEQGSAPEPLTNFDDLYAILAQAAQFYRHQLRQSQVAINYLKKRGLTGEIARDFGLGYAPPGWDNLLKTLGTDSDMRARLLKTGLIKQNDSGQRYDCFRDRVMFPILDRRERVIAFGGRKLAESEHEPKYLNSPETPLFQKSRELYGWHLARKVRPLQKIIVVEGYMDVVGLVQYGISNAVATLGTATTREHLIHLFRNVPEIIFCFDGDTAGQKAAWRALETVLPLIEDGRQVSFVFLPQGSDPDSLIRQENAQGFNNYLAQATPLSNYLFNTLIQQVDINHIDGRARLVELAKPLLKRLPFGAYLDLMLQKLSELTHVNQQNLVTLIQKGEVPKSVAVKKFQPVVSVKDLPEVFRSIVYLLNKPALSQLVEYPNKKLSKLNQQNIKLLLELIEFTRLKPQLTLGAICEHWRGTEYESIINQLATQKPLFTDTNKIDDDFLGAIDSLYESYRAQLWVELMQKNQDEWTNQDKQDYLNLVGQS